MLLQMDESDLKDLNIEIPKIHMMKMKKELDKLRNEAVTTGEPAPATIPKVDARVEALKMTKVTSSPRDIIVPLFKIQGIACDPGD
jgi:hypothetical protein